ncbi:MAG: hypothetical protein JW876_09620 [Candidatus Krumholzibacteriota bacterium]|nr:hypothetical protein [Candidatus Krumholzibacteriota bacterium]
MAVSRMLKVQLLAHTSIEEGMKRALREAGVLQLTDVELEGETPEIDEERLRGDRRRLETIEGVLSFLDPWVAAPSFLERIGAGPIVAGRDELERLAAEAPVEETAARCEKLRETIRGGEDEIARGEELLRTLAPWISIEAPLESLCTETCAVLFWSIPAKAAEAVVAGAEEACPRTVFVEESRDGAAVHYAVAVRAGEADDLAGYLKDTPAVRRQLDGLEGRPAEIAERVLTRRAEIEREIAVATNEARLLAANREDLLKLADHYRERIGLDEAGRLFRRTASTFVVEGWIRAADRPVLERRLGGAFENFEIAFREPREDEEPPIHLDNRPAVSPYEFVTTLYGRPIYREFDPTPLLAPFFVVFFAMCLTDAGYGFTLAAVSLFVILRFRPGGGAGKLFRILLYGGLVTAVVGIVAGGIFGIGAELFPPALRRFVLLDPLHEPMTMLNISFLMGIVHLLFGMGIRMVANLKARLVADAVCDQLFWMLFIVALAPLGFRGILGGEVPDPIFDAAAKGAGVLAVLIFLSGGRRAKNIAGKIFKGLVGFYDVVSYFGDVLSYARLLALGLATSAIAIAVNDIAAMVMGLPYYTGYVAMVLVLLGGHLFNLAVNTLGAFVHSGRLQYLEFFGKFFNGGGREFRPFRSERRHTVVRESETG